MAAFGGRPQRGLGLGRKGSEAEKKERRPDLVLSVRL